MSKSSFGVVKILKYVVSAILVLVALYALRLLAHAFLFDVFVIPSNSMLPTLQPGDRLLVSKVIAGPRLYRSLHIPPTPIGSDLEFSGFISPLHKGGEFSSKFWFNGWDFSFIDFSEVS